MSKLNIKLNLVYRRQSYKVIQKNIFVTLKKIFKFVGMEITFSTKSMVKHFFVKKVILPGVKIFFVSTI